MSPTLPLLFGLRARVRRGPYVAWGLGLAVVKFLVDTGIVYAFARKTWSPLGYVVPSLVLRREAVGDAPEAMHVLLVLAALPFLWIGLTMSVRRAADAGLSPWAGVGFLVPILNYVTILVLCVVPTRSAARWDPGGSPHRRGPNADEGPPSSVELPSGVRAALLGVLAAIGVGLAMIGISVYGLGLYGTALFFATPFAMGATTAAIYNGEVTRRLRDTLGLTAVATLLTGSILLLFAIEGILCLAMALPIAMALAVVGALVGRAIVTSSRHPAGASFVVAALPLLAAGEARFARAPVHDVTTTIEIDAPPEAVWPHVIGFSDLPEPPRWEYRLGVAYPVRARIDGQGVGAVRRCEFSTGPFVEPITVWDPPRRLAFDVVQQPPSMTEWSPYHDVKAPHLEGYMKSRGGEFRLVALPGRRTRLEGTTHYSLAIYPDLYWRGWAELLLHGIHTRVLQHVKRLTEDDVSGAAHPGGNP
ncbi:MAG: SRPBCC family protein [Polyangiaceae bacterium]